MRFVPTTLEHAPESTIESVKLLVADVLNVQNVGIS